MNLNADMQRRGGIGFMIIGLLGVAQGAYFCFYFFYAPRQYGGWGLLLVLVGIFSVALFALGNIMRRVGQDRQDPEAVA
jgi:hypothetical protein